MTRWLNHRNKQRPQLLMDNLQFRQNLRMLNQQEQVLDRLHNQCATQAIAAENDGKHRMAVHLAGEAANIKNFRMVSGSVKSSLEVAHAVKVTNRAITGIMAGTREMVNTLNCGQVEANACALQANMALIQDQIQVFMDQNEMFLDTTNAIDQTINEEGEEALAALMATTHKEKQRKLLQDTVKVLNNLPRHRTVNDGSKE